MHSVVWFLIPGADYVNRPALNVFLTALDQPDVMDATLVRRTLTRLLHTGHGRKQSLAHYCILYSLSVTVDGKTEECKES